MPLAVLVEVGDGNMVELEEPGDIVGSATDCVVDKELVCVAGPEVALCTTVVVLSVYTVAATVGNVILVCVA